MAHVNGAKFLFQHSRSLNRFWRALAECCSAAHNKRAGREVAVLRRDMRLNTKPLSLVPGQL